MIEPAGTYWEGVAEFLRQVVIVCQSPIEDFPDALCNAERWKEACEAYGNLTAAAVIPLLRQRVVPADPAIRFYLYARAMSAYLFALKVSLLPSLFKKPRGFDDGGAVVELMIGYWNKIGAMDVRPWLLAAKEDKSPGAAPKITNRN